MADGVFNCSKGRVAELVNRVKNNDPANSALVVVLLTSTGLVTDATMRDYATLSAILAGASDEATNTGAGRKVLTDTELSGYNVTVDNTNDRVDVDMPDLVWSAVSNDGTGGIGKLIVCYDNDTTTGTDANLVPLTFHDFVVTPNGGQITAQINASGFYRAA